MAEIFTPTAAEVAFIRSITDQPHRRFTAMLQLKTAQYLGRLAPIASTPERIVRHVAETLSFRRALRLDDLDAYDRSRTRDRHVTATSSDDNTDRLLKALEYCRDVRRESIPLVELGLTWPEDCTWLSAAWRKEVLIKTGAAAPASVRRRFFELAVLFHIKDELKSGDLFVPGANKFDDYRETLVDDATLAKELPLYGEATGLAIAPEQFVQNLRQAMRDRCESVNRRFPANADASFVDGRLILRNRSARR